MSDIHCADCGGWDIEWMYKCDKHGAEYCRGCSCPFCEEEKMDEYCGRCGNDYDYCTCHIEPTNRETPKVSMIPGPFGYDDDYKP